METQDVRLQGDLFVPDLWVYDVTPSGIPIHTRHQAYLRAGTLLKRVDYQDDRGIAYEVLSGALDGAVFAGSK